MILGSVDRVDVMPGQILISKAVRLHGSFILVQSPIVIFGY